MSNTTEIKKRRKLQNFSEKKHKELDEYKKIYEAQSFSLYTYQDFFLHFRNDPRMQSLIHEWRKRQNNSPYIQKINVVQEAYQIEALENFKEEKETLLGQIDFWKKEYKSLHKTVQNSQD